MESFSTIVSKQQLIDALQAQVTDQVKITVYEDGELTVELPPNTITVPKAD